MAGISAPRTNSRSEVSPTAPTPATRVTVPKGSRQRPASSSTGATTTRLVTSTLATPTMVVSSPAGPSASAMDGARLTKADRYWKKNSTTAVVRAVAHRAGSRVRAGERAGRSGEDQAERTGLVTISRPPASSSRCDGLSSAATPASTPNMVCQAPSATPPATNSTTPTSPRP